MTWERSWSPHLTPEVGSARIGQPASAASRAAASATGSVVGPQTISPRGSAAMRSATAWTSSEWGALAC
jgi:hypothetical protein